MTQGQKSLGGGKGRSPSCTILLVMKILCSSPRYINKNMESTPDKKDPGHAWLLT